jgi:ribosome maturation protein SDO1
MRGKPQVFEPERAHINVARLKKAGETFEVVIEPDKAIAFKHGEIEDIREALNSEHVYHDAKDGMAAGEHDLENVFGTTDELEVAKKILLEGDIQLTAAYREQLREQKLQRILSIIHTNAIDPKTGLPHPLQRLKNAMEEAKIHVDEQKKPEDQVQDIVKKMMPVLPIKFAVKDIQIILHGQYGTKCYGILQQYGKIKREQWMNDGSWHGIVEIPAGLQTEFFDALNKTTHGSVDLKILETR